jgi:hypothetical protein
MVKLKHTKNKEGNPLREDAAMSNNSNCHALQYRLSHFSEPTWGIELSYKSIN